MALFTILSKVSACWSVKELNVDASQQRLSRFTRQTIICRTIAGSVFMNVLAWIPYMEINQGTIDFWSFCAIFRSKSLDNGSCHQKNKAHQIWSPYKFAHAKIGGKKCRKIYCLLVDNKPFLLSCRLLVVFLLFVVFFLLVFLSVLFYACKGNCFFLRELFFAFFSILPILFQLQRLFSSLLTVRRLLLQFLHLNFHLLLDLILLRRRCCQYQGPFLPI